MIAAVRVSSPQKVCAPWRATVWEIPSRPRASARRYGARGRPTSDTERIRRRSVLNGLVSEYMHAA
jgi:hypothetical protein